MGHRVGRVQRKQLAKLPLRASSIAVLQQQRGQIEPCIGVTRIGNDRLAKTLLRSCRFARFNLREA